VPNQMIRDATLRAKTVFHRLRPRSSGAPRTVLILIWIVALVPMIHLTSLVRHNRSFARTRVRENPTGWSSLMAAILLLSGTQLLLLGIMGEYVGRIYLGINDKPQSVVRAKFTSSGRET
jgi:hypothetical protein